jgi:mRNA-degrading endonuclease RelE of RelBE toxin-antitoxin system
MLSKAVFCYHKKQEHVHCRSSNYMKFLLTPTAEEHLRRLPTQSRKRITSKVTFYAAQADPLELAEPISRSSSYRFRIGDYRVVFDVLNGAGWVHSIDRRDEAYRR